MNIEQLANLITESVFTMLKEGWYSKSTTPYFSKNDIHRNLGRNPLYVDNGNHSPADSITQPSTIDFNGARLDAELITLSRQGFTIYKIKNFGNDKVTSTLSFFGNGARGEKAFRNTIDTLYGAERRNNRQVIFRTIACTEDNPKKNDVYKSFWEFSYDNGNTWYIMKPNPLQSLKQSKLIRK